MTYEIITEDIQIINKEENLKRSEIVHLFFLFKKYKNYKKLKFFGKNSVFDKFY